MANTANTLTGRRDEGESKARPLLYIWALAPWPSTTGAHQVTKGPGPQGITLSQVKANLVQLSEYTWGRTWARLRGLTDDEYFWEPVPGCWSIRPGTDGAFHPDWTPAADPPPFTTMAWRMCHLISCYGERRNREWLGLPTDAASDSFEPTSPAPVTAADALARLATAYSEWATALDLVSEPSLEQPLGPVAGPFAEADRAGFVLHMLDEFIHHGAEIALLRDLWRTGDHTEGTGHLVAGLF